MNEKKIREVLKRGVHSGPKTVGANVSFEVYGIVQALARDRGVFASDIIRRAVELYLTAYVLGRRGW